MKRIMCVVFSLIMLIAVFPLNALAAGENLYYASGNYASSAKIKPTGLKFYVDYSAVTTYGASAFTVAFDWNGSYKGHVSAVATYPAPSSDFPNYFLINTKSFPTSTQAQTFYYNSSGTLIADPGYDSKSIYSCRISLNSNKSAFNVNGSYSTTFLKKVIRHEVGHVFLLKHPSNLYFSSVMHTGIPVSGTVRSATVTSDDKNNVKIKWGS